MTRTFAAAALAAILLLAAASEALAQAPTSHAPVNKPSQAPAGPATQTLDGADAVRAAIAAGANPAGRPEAAPTRAPTGFGPAVVTQRPPIPHGAPVSRRTKPLRKAR